jgi:hypothetical protein
VAMSSSWPTHLVSIAPMRHLVYTRCIDYPATPNPIDASRPQELTYILRTIITTALCLHQHGIVSYCCLLASSSNRDHAHVPLLRSFDITSHEKDTLTTESTEYELRAYIQKPTIGSTTSMIPPAVRLPISLFYTHW